MYFAPDGQVRACCVNTDYTLGRVPQQSIREIWEGARIASLRTTLEGRDFSLGCQDCEHRIAAGDWAWSTASSTTSTWRRSRAATRSGWTSSCPSPATSSA
ncbi:MAG: SPASM domain-containing protein [Acidimicrobiales bacterium]|nr:SPASM domain-containing protein [Acidimicrobiales bacterium]